MRIALLIILFVTVILGDALYAQEATNGLPTKVSKNTSDSIKDLLHNANSLRNTDRTQGFVFANRALDQAITLGDEELIARSHSLLGQLYSKDEKLEQALVHYTQSAYLYKTLGNTNKYIQLALGYIELYVKTKRYEKAELLLKDLLSLAKKHNNKLSIALVFKTHGDLLYAQKGYQSAIEKYLESVEYLTDPGYKFLKKKAENFKLLAQSYKRLSDREKTAEYYQKALEIYQELDDKKSVARTLNTLAESVRYLDDYESALNFANRSIEVHKLIDDPEGFAKALMGAGIIYRFIERYDTSLKHLHSAYLKFRELNDKNGIAKSSNQMGLIYTRLKQFEQAREFYQITIDLPLQYVDMHTYASALRELAVIDYNMNQFETAMIMAQRAYEIYQKDNDILKSSLTTRIIGDIYFAQQQEGQAIAYYTRSLYLANEVDSKIYIIKAYRSLGQALINTNLEEASKSMQASLDLATELNNKIEMLYAYQALRKIEKRRNNDTLALSYAEKEIELIEAIQEDKEKNELVKVKANLYSYKLEMDLSALKEKTKLNELELAKKSNEIEIAEQTQQIYELKLTTNRYASFALALLLIVCLCLVIFTYRRFIISRKDNKKLDYLASYDHLTNCYNRRMLLDILNRDLIHLRSDKEYCVIMVDLDNFKRVNDTYGHNMGDDVLKSVAKLLHDGIRKNDTIARFGGEELCIILPDTTVKQAFDVAENLRTKVESKPIHGIKITCSFGITSASFGAQSSSELIDQADIALYQSKNKGRNQVTIWSSHIAERKYGAVHHLKQPS